eukprot:scaffold7381_cov310-Pinguiococcus_pyrenoidosus.AAC.50
MRLRARPYPGSRRFLNHAKGNAGKIHSSYPISSSHDKKCTQSGRLLTNDASELNKLTNRLWRARVSSPVRTCGGIEPMAAARGMQLQIKI